MEKKVSERVRSLMEVYRKLAGIYAEDSAAMRARELYAEADRYAAESSRCAMFARQLEVILSDTEG